jgi:PadR family transcriptional regulator AphA
MARSPRTPFVILGLLGLSGREARSGYEIKKAIDTVISNFWSESNGQIYPALKALEIGGLVRAETQNPTGRRKTRYAITPKGRAQLQSWLASPVEKSKPRDELILKLFFGSETEVPVLLRHIERHRDKAQAILQQCLQYEEQNKANPAQYRPFVHMTIRAGVLLTEANLRWAEESLQALSALQAGGMARTTRKRRHLP